MVVPEEGNEMREVMMQTREAERKEVHQGRGRSTAVEEVPTGGAVGEEVLATIMIKIIITMLLSPAVPQMIGW